MAQAVSLWGLGLARTKPHRLKPAPLASGMVVGGAGICGGDVILAVFVFVFEGEIGILNDANGLQKSGRVGNRHRAARGLQVFRQAALVPHIQLIAAIGNILDASRGHFDPTCRSKACPPQRPRRSFPGECCRRESSRRDGRSEPSCWTPPRKIPGQIACRRKAKKHCAGRDPCWEIAPAFPPE